MVQLRFYRITSAGHTQYSEWLGPYGVIRVIGDQVVADAGVVLARMGLTHWASVDGKQWEGVLIRDERGETKVSLN